MILSKIIVCLELGSSIVRLIILTSWCVVQIRTYKLVGVVLSVKMKIPLRYAKLSITSKIAIGHLSTTGMLVLLGIFAHFRFIYVAILVSWAGTLGNLLSRTQSPYYWGWDFGNSMMPSIPSGSTMSIRTTDFEKIEIGDVISYEVPEYADHSNKNNIHHRVIGKLDNGGYIMKGDGNNSLDGFVVYDENIVSKTVQYGYQPLYIPISPSSIAFTISKIYRKVIGQHTEMLKDTVETEKFTGDCSLVLESEE